MFFLSQYLQLVQGRRLFEAGLAELPAAIGAVVAGLIAGRAARRFSVRAVVSGGLAAVGLALAALTVVGQNTGYPLLGAVLLVVGGRGLLVHRHRRRDPVQRAGRTGGRRLAAP